MHVHTIESATRPSKYLWGRVEKTNKSKLRNLLTYRVLIYIFEVGMKTFFLKWENPNLKKSKAASFFFPEVGGWIFFGFKTFPEMSLNFCKSKILWWSDWFLSLRGTSTLPKYHGPIVVRCVASFEFINF